MTALTPVIEVLSSVIALLRPVLFGVAAVTTVFATASWAVRTRRIGPFTAIARLTRRSIDPLFLPTERRVVRMGGMPANAPWWTVAVIAVGGLVLLALLDFVKQQLMMLAASSYGGPKGILLLVVDWGFLLLKVALLARVISSWVGGGPHSRWWRWSYKLTDWFLGPLRRVLPTFGPIDLSPLVAYFGLTVLQWLLRGL